MASSSVSLIPAAASVIEGAPGSGSKANGFLQALEKTDSLVKQANRLAAGYALGKNGVTEAVVAAKEADIALSLMMALRTQAVRAYQAIANMQL